MFMFMFLTISLLRSYFTAVPWGLCQAWNYVKYIPVRFVVEFSCGRVTVALTFILTCLVLGKNLVIEI